MTEGWRKAKFAGFKRQMAEKERCGVGYWQVI